MCCVAAAHLQVPVESKQEEQMFKRWQSVATVTKSNCYLREHTMKLKACFDFWVQSRPAEEF